jgi:hypothetical protein
MGFHELCFALNQKKGTKGEWVITLSTQKGIQLPRFFREKTSDLQILLKRKSCVFHKALTVGLCF